MFEEFTYEAILGDMLSKVDNGLDKREGSVMMDILSPCAYHLAQAYTILDNYIDLIFLDKAAGEYLDRNANNYRIFRKEPTYAERKIITNGAVELGTTWGINDTTYTITELIQGNVYRAKCNQGGTIGNIYEGNMDNIDNVSGITATLSDVIELGQEEETDDSLRYRLYSHIQRPSASGNANNYHKWALSVPGVGGAKVFPLWDGTGTVKVVITNNNKMPVTNDLIEETANYIESVRPIGAEVTVISCTDKTIHISAIIDVALGYNLQTAIQEFRKAAEDYFRLIAFTTSYVSIAKIGTLLLSTEGIVDYSDLSLNGAYSNISLTEEEVPVIGLVELEGVQ